jgi:peroxiredoxin
MRSLTWRTSVVLVASCLPFLALQESVRPDEVPSAAKIGKKIDNIAMSDSAGKPAALHDFLDKNAVVVVFLSFDCPISCSYVPVLAELCKTFGDKGVAFLGVVPGTDEALAKHIKDYQVAFPIWQDPRGLLAEALKAEVTPEAFVLDGQFVLRYRGRIDDGYAARLKKNTKVTQHDLRQALDELLADKAVSAPVTVAVGCPIAREHHAKASGSVTFHRDVEPILQNHCQGCHRPGEVGPFSLMNYKQAVAWASDIKDYTQNRKMPPWKPVEGLPFHNERKLADQEVATLAAWVDGGTPEGDVKDAPPPRIFPDGWQLGKPDLILTPCDDYQVGPSGDDVFRCFVIPTNLTEDQYVTGVEVRPGNPRVVHHSLLYIDTRGKGRELEQTERDRPQDLAALDRGPGYSTGMGGIGFIPQGSLSGWAPGQLGRTLPEDTYYRLPKNSDVIMQIHYHRDGRLEKDRTSVGLYFAKKPVHTPWKGMILPAFFDNIPADAEHFPVTGGLITSQDCLLRSVMPHMHMVGKEVKITVQPPDGPKQTLVAIKDWDYNWQETYFLKEPISLKAGTRIEVQAVFDNSSGNPSNPSRPPRDVEWGEQTTDEMCYIFLGATSDDQPGTIKYELTDKVGYLKFQLRNQNKAQRAKDAAK